MQDTADVIIIGAGIIGAACAFHLGERGAKVTVLEMQHAPALGSTGKSAAGVRVQFTEEVNIRLSWESIQRYRQFLTLYGEDVGYLPIGYLLLVPPEQWADHLESVALQQHVGAPVNVLSLVEAQQLVPFETAGLAGATHGPADGIVDPHSTTLAFLKLARERGVVVQLNSPVTGIRRVGSTWRVETPQGVYTAAYLLNASGAWAGSVAQLAGLDVPIEPVRRQIYSTTPLPRPHVYPLTIDCISGFYLRSEGQRVLFGRSNPNEPPGFTEGMDWDWFEQTLAVGVERFPWLAETQLDTQASWWGYYEVTPDHYPILGRMPGVDNWVNAAGFSGHGVQQAPAIGKVIAEEILDGRAHSIVIDPLRIERFAKGLRAREHNIF
ncbi:MAG TPA: FAD-binding oxidoreductase [Ktedonobacteraceae bacterium]|nr:FAD-binding oxidoreductase [Ktedonobacteraceae bacterium]